MEHFLPLAVASMALSLISFSLVDYFSSKSATTFEGELLSGAANDGSIEEASVLSEEDKKTDDTTSTEPRDAIKTIHTTTEKRLSLSTWHTPPVSAVY